MLSLGPARIYREQSGSFAASLQNQSQACACNEDRISCLDYRSSKLKTRGLKRKVNGPRRRGRDKETK